MTPPLHVPPSSTSCPHALFAKIFVKLIWTHKYFFLYIYFVHTLHTCVLSGFLLACARNNVAVVARRDLVAAGLILDLCRPPLGVQNKQKQNNGRPFSGVWRRRARRDEAESPACACEHTCLSTKRAWVENTGEWHSVVVFSRGTVNIFHTRFDCTLEKQFVSRWKRKQDASAHWITQNFAFVWPVGTKLYIRKNRTCHKEYPVSFFLFSKTR